MKIVKIQGGLGNQMFQYALMLSLRDRYTETILADVTMFKNYDWHEFELERIFNIQLHHANKKDLQKVSYYFDYYYLKRLVSKIFGRKSTEFVEKVAFSYDNSTFSVVNDRFYDGYWINKEYFGKINLELRRHFIFKNKLNNKNQITLNEIEKTESVSIHVRRGNYLFLDAYIGICELDYYKSAINYIRSKKKDVVFYVFSNDINWCKENLITSFKSSNFRLIDWNMGNDNYVDMQLMSMCKHNIIAHSTFSWWSAWLNNNPYKIVIAPKKWVNNSILTPNLSDWVAI